MLAKIMVGEHVAQRTRYQFERSPWARKAPNFTIDLAHYNRVPALCNVVQKEHKAGKVSQLATSDASGLSAMRRAELLIGQSSSPMPTRVGTLRHRTTGREPATLRSPRSPTAKVAASGTQKSGSCDALVAL